MNIVLRFSCRTFQLCFRLAIPVLPYREPEVVGSAAEAAEKLERFKRVLMVTDKGVAEAGLLEPLKEALEARGTTCSVYDRTVANPTVRNVEEAREQYIREGCQAIVGVGGGDNRLRDGPQVPHK